MLQQAIERVGLINRAAVISEIQTGSFETVLGTVKLNHNIYENTWWVEQWQNGEFNGIAPASLPGAVPIWFPKPPWHAEL
jgi:branched-chain amino acid transport system substrate-binding protein